MDIASVDFKGPGPEDFSIETVHTFPLPKQLKISLQSLLSVDIKRFSKIESDYTFFVAECIVKFCKLYSCDASYCGIHGHTVLHLKDIKRSIQIVNAGLLSSLVKKTVISDFRNQDLGAGGEGTPMAVLVDKMLFGDYDYCINLGGIANISYCNSMGDWLAYDLAPCNQVHNLFAQQSGSEFDMDGQLARKGQLHQGLYDHLLSDAYILNPPPKSIDNEWIHSYWIPKMKAFELDANDYLKTHNFFLASLVSSICNKPKSKILLTGGGAKNKYFVELLNEHIIEGVQVVVPNEQIIDYKESLLMAYMSYCRMNENYNFIPSASGAKFPVVAGAVYIYKQNT